MILPQRRSKQMKIENLVVGGGAPVVVEGMLKQDIKKFDTSVEELRNLVREGCELVRVALPTRSTVPFFKKLIAESPVPLMADVHFSWSLAREAIASGAPSVRVNPGNMRRGGEMRRFAKEAQDAKVVVRIGANSGSIAENNERLSADEVVKRLSSRTLDFIKLFEDEGVTTLIVGAKSSSVSETVSANRIIARECEYPIHIGVTATGAGKMALLKSASAISTLLLEGIGDTVRVSLTDTSEEEVRIGRQILQVLGLRRFSPEIISCPTCGRCKVDLQRVVEEAEKRLFPLPGWLKIAIMGCVVNGPGEAREADLGIAYGVKKAVIFAKGKKVKYVSNISALSELIKILNGSNFDGSKG
ncbi:MAG: flavodoxin-dependent (E)-4-hydroxy-3-methylbut-2-enyl-diphosphate synthase [Planctomycetota bacterium]|nr:flavodoxin-dependent (E)-4-hydroxy-3-methylbut-2-enyl-diphosphate synthase [Planctomycetota bacterium]